MSRTASNGMPCCKDIPNSGRGEIDAPCSLCSTPMTKTQELEVVAGLAERLLMSAVDMERKFLHRIDHMGEEWRLANPNGEAAAALMREAQAALSAAEAERDALRKALLLIDALDPEEHVQACSADALRGLVNKMGAEARKALEVSK